MHFNLGVASDILEVVAFFFITPEVINWNLILQTLHAKTTTDPEGVNAIIIITCLILGLLTLGGLFIWIDNNIAASGRFKAPAQGAAIAPAVLVLPFLRRYLEEERNRRKVAKWIALFGALLFLAAKGLSILHFSVGVQQ